MKPPTKIKIARRLRWLAAHMADTGADIDYYGGMAEWAQHGRDLLGAARIARCWANAIEAEVIEEKGKAK